MEFMLFKSTAGQNPTLLPIDPIKLETGQICFSSTRNNCRIRSLFQKDVSIPYVVADWNTFINNLDWKKNWNLAAKYMRNNSKYSQILPIKSFFK